MSNKTERGIQAHHLIDEGLFAESLAKLETDYLKQWRAAQTSDEREELHRLILTIDRFKADMRSVITTGDIERKSKEPDSNG